MGIKKKEIAGICIAIALMFVMGMIVVLFAGWLTGGKGGDAMDSGVMTSSEADRNEISIWYYNDEFAGFLEMAAAQYKEERGIVLNCKKVREDNYLESVNESNISGENVPDIYLMNSTMLEKAVLAGLTEENTNGAVYNDSIYSNTAVAAVTYKKRMQAYPLNFDTSFLVYNKAYVQDAPVTFDDIINYSNSIDENVSSQVENILLWDVKNLMYNYGFAGGYLEYGGKNGDDESVKSFNNDSLVQSMAYYHNLNQIFSIDINTETYDDVINRFSQGKVVFAIIKTDGIKKLEVAENHVEYGVSGFPDMNGELKAKPMSVTNVAVVNPYAYDCAAASQVAEYLSYSMAACMYDATGKLSAKKDIKYQDEKLGIIVNQYDNSINLPKLMGAGDFGAKLESVLNRIWQGADIVQLLQELER